MRRLVIAISIGIFLFGTAPQSNVIGLQACDAIPLPEESEFHLFGRPVVLINPANQLKIDELARTNYEFRNNGVNKMVDWIATRVESSLIGSAPSSPNYSNDLCLADDRRLEADPADQDDYLGAFERNGYVRTPLISRANFGNSSNGANFDIYTNIVPMHHGVVDVWNEFDRLVREYVIETGQTVYVIAGPEFRREMPSLPEANEDHKVPSGFWKFAYAPNLENTFFTRMSTLWVDQHLCVSSERADRDKCVEDANNWQQRTTPIRPVDIESYTKLRFFQEGEFHWHEFLLEP